MLLPLGGSTDQESREGKPSATSFKKQKLDKRAVSSSTHPSNDAHPFQADFCDHFETSSQAYEHVKPVLDSMCEMSGRSKSEFVLYDPYYCSGTVVKRLHSLGYPNVVHENIDFYSRIETSTVPDFNVLITNPPYRYCCLL